MPDYSTIIALFDEMDIQVIGAIIQDTKAPRRYFVHISVSRDANNRQVPSNQRLNAARSQLDAKGISVEVLLTDAHSQDIEVGLRATLLHGFGNDIRNAFMSLSNRKVDVWLEPKRAFDPTTEQAIRKKINQFVSLFDIELNSISVTTGENLPSTIACLRAIRVLAPVDAYSLKQELEIRGFTVPSIDWMKRRLDKLRRKGQVVRLEGDRFALPLDSIRSLGTTKGRDSSDINRVLALARRRS